MHVKITQPGWDSYTGPLGRGIQFVNGVSAEDINRRDALALGACILVVEIDQDGKELGPVSPAHDLLLTGAVVAEVTIPLARGVPDEADTEATPPVAVPTGKYTKEELEKIASEKGIAGLREIAAPYGCKNTAIQGLVRDILTAQTAVKN